ncbi:MAG: DUF6950 family protein [Rhodobacterales bacterium]
MMTQKRLSNWPLLLATEIEAARTTPFAWGQHDCALFAADVVLAITGSDPAAAVRGSYRSQRGSARVLKRLGCDTLEEAATKALGQAVSCALLQRGDVALLDLPTGPTLGICVGATVAAPAETGLAFLPLDNAIKGWHL